MEVTSLTLAVVGLFKDAYLTIKFVHRCLSTIRKFRESHADMALRYGIQIHRLRWFWAAFTGKMDDTISIKAINKDPNVSSGIICSFHTPGLTSRNDTLAPVAQHLLEDIAQSLRVFQAS